MKYFPKINGRESGRGRSVVSSVTENSMKYSGGLVCIIVLNWNGWQDTLECLESLRRLDYPNFRVLVVDNGSTDDSVERFKKFSLQDELIETGRNLGYAGGNNV